MDKWVPLVLVIAKGKKRPEFEVCGSGCRRIPQIPVISPLPRFLGEGVGEVGVI